MKPSSTSITMMSRKKCGEGTEQLVIQKTLIICKMRQRQCDDCQWHWDASVI